MDKQRLNFLSRAIATAISCSLVFNAVGSAQSAEMDRPTSLSAPQVSITFNTPNVVHYYSFNAGPGEVTIMVGSKANGGAFGGGTVYWTLYDQDSKKVDTITLSSGSTETQEIHRYTLKTRMTVLLKVDAQMVCVCAPTQQGGLYRFRLSGAVDVGGGSEAWLTGIPHEGLLTLRMKDGSTREIDLKEVAGISIR
jgi:hypothetical protein